MRGTHPRMPSSLAVRTEQGLEASSVVSALTNRLFWGGSLKLIFPGEKLWDKTEAFQYGTGHFLKSQRFLGQENHFLPRSSQYFSKL